jgi:hypothetical protein
MTCRPLCQGRTTVFGHIVTDKLEALCFSPLSFKLRPAVRLPQGLRRVPRHQHDAETYDRTGYSEHQAIIYFVGVHILRLFLACAECGATISPNDRLAAEPSNSCRSSSSSNLLKPDYRVQK